MDIHTLRQRHPVLHYHDYDTEIEGTSLLCRWHFELEPDITFTPTLRIEHLPIENWLSLDEGVRANLIFHLGLAELPSYWKAACSPRIEIHAGTLDEGQIEWWQQLFHKGLGEFYFTNEIDFTGDDFLTIVSTADRDSSQTRHETTLQDRTLLPIGGGKDSTVALEVFKNTNETILPWALNPIPASERVVATSETGPLLSAQRRIDPTLLQLNEQGYLNGHTPFSAYLAFLTTTMSILLDTKHIAVSNESSANECNTVYRGVEINHQYSKTEPFERAFREYVQDYISTESNYYSLLRPLNELQIAGLFSQSPAYFTDFRSCNRGQKEDRWCHACSKCLFTYLMLAAFLDRETLTTEIFDRDLFEDASLVETALDLTEPSRVKPLDCVGTYAESHAAAALVLDRWSDIYDELPPVLTAIEEVLDAVVQERQERDAVIAAQRSYWDATHHVPDALIEQLKMQLKELT